MFAFVSFFQVHVSVVTNQLLGKLMASFHKLQGVVMLNLTLVLAEIRQLEILVLAVVKHLCMTWAHRLASAS